jgi:TonB family protein
MKRQLCIAALLAICAAAHAEPSSPTNHAASKGRAVAIYAPAPEYPIEARARRITGRGVVVVDIDQKTGWVLSARMEKSTGSKLLDDAAVAAFKHWRFKPGSARQIHSPIAFTLGGKF